MTLLSVFFLVSLTLSDIAVNRFPPGCLFRAVGVTQQKGFYVMWVDYLAGVAGFGLIGFWVPSTVVYWSVRCLVLLGLGFNLLQ